MCVSEKLCGGMQVVALIVQHLQHMFSAYINRQSQGRGALDK